MGIRMRPLKSLMCWGGGGYSQVSYFPETSLSWLLSGNLQKTIAQKVYPLPEKMGIRTPPLMCVCVCGGGGGGATVMSPIFPKLLRSSLHRENKPVKIPGDSHHHIHNQSNQARLSLSQMIGSINDRFQWPIWQTLFERLYCRNHDIYAPRSLIL